jgi:SNF2 family DNA or RNA helicase
LFLCVELWGLLHFIQPKIFKDAKRFEQVFGKIDWRRSKLLSDNMQNADNDNENDNDNDDDMIEHCANGNNDNDNDNDDDEQLRKQVETIKLKTLHSILRAFMLRRTKDNVQLQLPSKREIVVSSGMTAMQRQFYLWILTKNAEKLSGPSVLQNGM